MRVAVRGVGVVTMAVLAGCAGGPQLPTIRHGEPVAISVAMSPPADGRLGVRNEALGTGVSAGVGTGLVAGGLWGLVCGPLAVLCVPLGALTGAVTGSAAGAVIGVTGALADDKVAKLRDRLAVVARTHPLAAEIQDNVSTRALRYWPVNAGPGGTRVTIQLHDLRLMSTRDEQIRCAVSLTVSVEAGGRSASKDYSYLGGYSALSVWLDPASDFVDTSLTAASQQLAAQIVADLVSH